MFAVESTSGEHENALMAEHFELQVSQVDKFLKPRPPPSFSSEGEQQNCGHFRKGEGGHRGQNPQGNPESGLGCIYPRYTFPQGADKLV